MSSMQIGTNLLGEVEALSLDKLLASLRRSNDRCSTPRTNITELDRLLDILAQPSASSADGFNDQPSLQHVEYDGQAHATGPERITHASSTNHSPSKPPILIEISVGEARAEATDFCYFLTAASILPHSTGGKQCCTVWFDTETKFSALRLYQVCLKYQCQGGGDLKPLHEREHLAREALKHVHVFPIHSSKQLLSVLGSLPAYLLDNPSSFNTTGISLPKHHSSSRCLSLVVLDSATSFYWPDRFDTEIAQLESKSTYRSSIASETYTPQILTHLRNLHVSFDCSVVYTTDGSATQLHTRHQSTHKSTPAASYELGSTNITGNETTNQLQDPGFSTAAGVAPPPPADEPSSQPGISQWTTSCNLSLNLSIINPPLFGAYMSLEECLRDRPKRAGAARANRVKVSVNNVWVDRVVRDTKVKGALKAMNAKGGFVMRCTDEGVEIEK